MIFLRFPSGLQLPHAKLFLEMKFQQNMLIRISGENGVGKSSFFHWLKLHRSQFFAQPCAFLDQGRLSTLAPLTIREGMQIFNEYFKNFLRPDVIAFQENFIAKYQMSNFLNHKINELSGGENQLVKILYCFSQQADWFFMDEPFQFLDESRRQLLKADFLALVDHKQKTITFNDHQREFALAEIHAQYRMYFKSFNEVYCEELP